jgi:hypothetical protein
VILWAYEGPNGVVTDLSGLDGIDELGVQGAGMPSYDLLTRSVPGGTGEIVEAVQARSRTVTVPIAVQSRTRSGRALEDRLEQLADALAPEDGPGRLLATRADDLGQPLTYLDEDGVTRRTRTRALRCWFQGGMETDLSWQGGSYGGFWLIGGLVLYADRAYYEPLVPQMRRFTSPKPVDWFPFLPLVIGGDSAIGGSIETNPGAIEAWPVIRVEHPGTLLRATNLTTGESWSVITNASEGQAVTVDTRPPWLGGGKTVSRDDGLSLYDQLDGSLWPLARGQNQLQIEVVNGTADSLVTFTYWPQYRTP